MPLSHGTRFGPYEILAPIGAGGMGEVYKARDTKLDREVAVKVLPPEMANDRERLARFEREAKVLASLNHPNIAQIYGLESNALIMELIPGQTLQTPQPIETVLNYAKQIAEALEAAHDKGITHRDLKPANIMVTPDGVVKVLDFGLATVPAREATANTSNSPTLTMGSTQAGLIMGTAAYMSPEQARGQLVDRRADIWAFGVILWEMCTGRQMFSGDTVSDTLAAVLTQTPDLTGIPPRLRPVLEACLQKDPRQRLRNIGDWRLALAPEQPQPTRKTSHLPWIAALVLAAIFAILWQRASSRQEPPIALRMAIPNIYGIAQLSPDGTAIVNADSGTLTLRSLAELHANTLPGTEGATSAFWAADSSAIGFFQQGKLCIYTLKAREVRCLADAPAPDGAAWRGNAASGDIVFVSRRSLFRLSLPSAAVTPISVQFPAGQFPLRPSFLPEGDDFVVTGGSDASRTGILYRVPLRGGAPVPLLNGMPTVYFARHPKSRQWHLFYAAFPYYKLVAVPVNPATGESLGEPVQLLDSVGLNTVSRQLAVSVSTNGRMLFRRNLTAAAVFRIRWHAPDGKVLTSLSDKVASSYIRLSPDETQVAAVVGYPRRSVVVFDARTGNLRRLTGTSDNAGSGLVWSPDGKTIYYQLEQPDGTRYVVRQFVESSARPEPIGIASPESAILDISVDGKYLILSPVGRSLHRLSTAAAASTSTTLPEPEQWAALSPDFPAVATTAHFTPDGKFLFVAAFGADGQFIPWPPAQTPVAIQAGNVNFRLNAPFFSSDGRRLCGMDRDTKLLYCQSVVQGPGGRPDLGSPTVLFESVWPQRSAVAHIGAIAKDGRVLLLSTDEPEEISTQFISDWTMLLPGAANRE